RDASEMRAGDRMANERVRVAIIGAGWAGRAHARFYKRVPFVDVVGWADVVPGKAAEAAAEAGLPPSGIFEDYKQMLAQLELDAVSVCTFNMGHRQPTLDALWLMGDPRPVSVSAITGNPLIKGFKGVKQTFAGPWSAADVDVEEFAFAFVRFENDAALTVKSTWAANADTLGRPFFLG